MSGRDETHEGKPRGDNSEQDQCASDKYDQSSAVPHSDQPSQTPSNPPSYSLIFGSLPYAKGSRNGFAGELFDAALVGLISPVCNIFRAIPASTGDPRFGNPPALRRSYLSRNMILVAKAFPAAFVVLSLLSTSGIDYRRFENILGSLRMDEDDVRSDERAESSCIFGCVGGAVSGAIIGRMCLLPVGLRTWMIYGASWGTFLSNGFSANIAVAERNKKMRQERLRRISQSRSS